MFEEWDKAGGDRNKLLGRYIHVIDKARFHVDKIAFAAANNAVGSEVGVFFNRRIGLSDNEGLLAIGGEIVEVSGDLAVFDFAVRGFEETEIVNAGKGCQRSDQADVGAFRGFDGANTAI